jgi:alcohol dehydrogenase (cytochrome c)
MTKSIMSLLQAAKSPFDHLQGLRGLCGNWPPSPQRPKPRRSSGAHGAVENCPLTESDVLAQGLKHRVVADFLPELPASPRQVPLRRTKRELLQLLPAAIALFVLPAVFLGQGLDPASILKPATNSWPTYAGDYTQRRYSILTQINRTNVQNLTLAWVSHLTAGPGGGGRGFGGRGAGPTIVGGVSKTGVDIPGSSSGSPDIKGSILQVNGVLYISSPDNAWAMDALDGHILWHYWWKSRGGDHIGNRGMAMYHNWLYFETPDDYLVSLDAKTGKERWHKEISDFNEHYFSTTAPVVVGDHVLVGTSINLDEAGFLQSFDPTTGDLQWKFYTVPMKEGDPGLSTWPSLEAARHGGGTVWMPGSYDPQTHLYIFGTGNPIPAYTAAIRGPKDQYTDLYTCSIIAVNVDTGKMAWYFQTSPDDTHDWDSTEAPVLVNGMFDGKPRKMVMQAARNGYFYVLDRTNGKHLLTSRFSASANWAKGILPNGQVVRNPEKDNTIPGSLVSGTNGGATNWPPPSFDPQTNLFYVTLHEGYAMYYATLKNPRMFSGLGGSEQDGVGSLGDYIAAINYQNGKVVQEWEVPDSPDGFGAGLTGLLTTAGHLLFDGVGPNLIAFDVTTLKPLWHAHIGGTSNAPETYMLDGKQYVLEAGGGSIWAFYLQ